MYFLNAESEYKKVDTIKDKRYVLIYHLYIETYIYNIYIYIYIYIYIIIIERLMRQVEIIKQINNYTNNNEFKKKKL